MAKTLDDLLIRVQPHDHDMFSKVMGGQCVECAKIRQAIIQWAVSRLPKKKPPQYTNGIPSVMLVHGEFNQAIDKAVEAFKDG